MKDVVIGAVVILAVFLIVLSQIPLGIEPLTELYLENHTALPVNVYLLKTYNFSFTTHNLEYQDVLYNYTVNAYDENHSLLFPVGSGGFTLANNESKTINESYRFNKSFGRAEIEVNITKTLIGTPEFKKKLWWPDPNYPYSIDVHFWVDEIVKGTVTITPA